MARRLLERLEQGVRSGRRQHVDLVDDVHLPAPGSTESGPGDEIPHRLDPIVRRRVELVDVEGGAQGNLHARLTRAAGLTVELVGAVEDLGQDARRRRLARAPRPAEQVGVSHPSVARRVAKRSGDVVLPLHLAEPLGSVATIERLIGLIGHGGPDYRRAASSPPVLDGRARLAPARLRAVTRCGSQADCGTREGPLRAAASRP